MPLDQLHPGNSGRFANRASDPRTHILAANQATIAALADGVMSDESFLALIGEAASGKTTIARALHEGLTARSVRVLQIGKAASGEISARQIVAEVLGVPEAELGAADVECFVRVMTHRKQPGPRFVLIIDDAELLRPHAIGCLRLLATVAPAVAAQVIFVGRPRFWQVLGDARANGLIGRHWELARPDAGEADRSAQGEKVQGERDQGEQDRGEKIQSEKIGTGGLAAAAASRRRPRPLARVAVAAMAMSIAGPLALHRAPPRSGFDAGAGSAAGGGMGLAASEQPRQTGSGAGRPLGEQVWPERAPVVLSSSDQPGHVLPIYPPEAVRAEAAAANVRRIALIAADTAPAVAIVPDAEMAAAIVPASDPPEPPAVTPAGDAVPQPLAEAAAAIVPVQASETPEPPAPIAPPPPDAPAAGTVAQLPANAAPAAAAPAPAPIAAPPPPIAPAPVPPSKPGSGESLSANPPDLALLLSRGDAMLELGDISAARRLYERAAELGSARAATAVGKTYDPAFLASMRARGIVPDPTTAAEWYRKAVALGDREAAARLARLTPN
jgi:hypothetical protein